MTRPMKWRRMRWAGRVELMGVKRNAYKFLVGRYEVRSPLGGIKPRWDGNIKMNLKEIGWEGVD